MCKTFFGRFFALLAVACLVATPVAAQNTSNPTSTDLVRIVRVDPAGGSTQGAVAIGKLYAGIGAGYAAGAGAGGVVTQITSRATAVTLNTYSGQVTMFAAAGSATAASFTVTNNKILATDTIVLSVASATNVYLTDVTAVAAGSFQITYFTTGGTASDSPVINFAVVHAAAS